MVFNATYSTRGAGTAYHSGASEFIPDYQWGSCCSIFNFLFLKYLQIIVCPFVLFRLVIVSSVLRFTTYGYPIVSSVLRFTTYGYPFGILQSLCRLSLDLRLMVIPLVSCGHCVVCPQIYDLWLPLWYLVVIVSSVLRFTTYGYSFGILWSLCRLSLDLRLMVTPLRRLSLDLRLMITPLVSCGHCVVCPQIYDLWLLLWYLVVIVSSVLRFTTYGYPFGIFKLFL